MYFVYAMRRVDCPTCGVTVERVPWAEGKCHSDDQLPLVPGALGEASVVGGGGRHLPHHLEKRVRVGKTRGFVGRWCIGTSARIEAIGVDEIQWQRGHRYLTLVYQIEDGMKRLLWVAEERTEESLRGFFQMLSDEVAQFDPFCL